MLVTKIEYFNYHKLSNLLIVLNIRHLLNTHYNLAILIALAGNSMMKEFRFLLMLTCIGCLLSIQSNAQNNWEMHLNLKGISKFLSGERADLLVKKKISDKSYLRGGLNSSWNSKNYVENSSFEYVESWSNMINLGIEKRTALDSKFYFTRGADLLYSFGGHNTKADSVEKLKLYPNSREIIFGIRGFVGMHYQIAPHFAISTETHLQVQRVINRGFYIVNPDPSSERQTFINFLPFQYLTISVTF